VVPQIYELCATINQLLSNLWIWFIICPTSTTGSMARNILRVLKRVVELAVVTMKVFVL
jgi:hypothetical protein